MSSSQRNYKTLKSINEQKFSFYESTKFLRKIYDKIEKNHSTSDGLKIPTIFKNIVAEIDDKWPEEIFIQAAEGTGLAFVVFTEAILQFPFPPLWAILFFMMLLMLGLGSMFGMLEGVITSLNDAKMIPLSKPILAAILCTSACIIGLVFTTQAGQYWVSLFDQFAGSYALMCVAFFEIIAVIYVYGCDRFVRDLQYMTNEPVGLYWTITWRFISPVIMVVIFVASVFKSFSDVPKYSAYDSTTV
uniref:Sodium-dependent neutral amino acid transporter B(0)AT3 n=1 Tax=Globodera pallida TaxID=36090 RepID=A0A183C181_GLOPA